MGKVFSKEDDQDKNRGCDAHIGEVENRIEENDLPRIVGDKREEEHIHDLSLQPRGIASTGRQEISYLPEGMGEDDAIKHGVDEIADGTCKDKSNRENESGSVAVANEVS